MIKGAFATQGQPRYLASGFHVTRASQHQRRPRHKRTLMPKPNKHTGSQQVGVTAFPYRTQKQNELRMCLIFSARLSDKFAINLIGGKYRRIGGGMKGWLVHPNAWDKVLSVLKECGLCGMADDVHRCMERMETQHVKEVHRI